MSGLPQQGSDEIRLTSHVEAGENVGDVNLRALPSDGRSVGSQGDADFLAAVNKPFGVDVRVNVPGELGGVMTLSCQDRRQTAA